MSWHYTMHALDDFTDSKGSFGRSGNGLSSNVLVILLNGRANVIIITAPFKGMDDELDNDRNVQGNP